MMLKLLLIALVVINTGCSIIAEDRRDAPWDPRRGSSMMDQIPNWDGEAQAVCCGRQWPNCGPRQSNRC